MLNSNFLIGKVIQEPFIGLVLAFLFAFIEALPIVGTLVPGIALMSLVGYWIGSNIISFYQTVLVCFIGALIGDYISYWVGLKYSTNIMNINYFKKRASLIEKAEYFLNKYGAFAIIIGRFVGPVRSSVPIIAGLLKMNVSMFFLGAVPSALLWTLIYISPGVIYASLAMSLPKSFSGQFLSYLLVVFIFSFYYRYQFEISQYLSRKLHYSAKMIHLILSFITSWSIFFWIIYSVITHSMIDHLNMPIYYLFQSMRTITWDHIMLSITYLGSVNFVASFVLIWTIFAFLEKRYTHMQHLFLNLFIMVILTHLFKAITLVPRPMIGDLISSSYSFPSGHTAVVASIMATIRWACSNNIHPSLKWTNNLYILVVGLTAISRVYLGMHWLTDVIAAIFLAHPIYCLSSVIIESKSELKIQSLLKIILISLSCMVVSMVLFPAKIDSIKNYQINRPIIEIEENNWQSKELSLLRYNRTHQTAEPFNIQYLGSMNTLDAIMAQDGWSKVDPNNLSNVIYRLDSAKFAYTMPFFKQLYLGQDPIASYYKNQGKTLYVLKLWQSEYYIKNQAVLLGTIIEVDQPNTPHPWFQKHKRIYTIKPLTHVNNNHYIIVKVSTKTSLLNQWDHQVIKIEGSNESI
ncbi:MAG: hypothetical protein CMF42_03795 [Legionellales bacterium]|nr:hypothetical protein [Legionellales bacterium]OUX67467.1 MAG: hypothetical protein CBD38_02175 [bacterium TMED178]